MLFVDNMTLYRDNVKKNPPKKLLELISKVVG